MWVEHMYKHTVQHVEKNEKFFAEDLGHLTLLYIVKKVWGGVDELK